MEEGLEMERGKEKREVDPLEEEPSPPFVLWESLSPARKPLEEHDTTDKAVGEGREKLPHQEGGQESTEPSEPESFQNPDNAGYQGKELNGMVRNERREVEEEEEQERETRGGPSGTVDGTGS